MNMGFKCSLEILTEYITKLCILLYLNFYFSNCLYYFKIKTTEKIRNKNQYLQLQRVLGYFN